MSKIIAALCLLLVHGISHADNATYNLNTGLLTLPAVNTPQGVYNVKLKLSSKSLAATPVQFTLSSVTPTGVFFAGANAASFNGQGTLNIPNLNSQQGVYAATLQLSGKSAAKTTFNLTSLTPYVLPKQTKLSGCSIFPADNVWNTAIAKLPVHSRSAAWIKAIGSAKSVHLDFGSGEWDGGSIGIPYNIVNSAVTPTKVQFNYPDEYDNGPYPIPQTYKLEAAIDRHLLVINIDNCHLYELYNAAIDNNGIWTADTGAIWNLNSNQLRRINWTSADAAGLPIFPGLVRYDEVASGFIGHALRFTLPYSSSYIWPARHLTDGMIKVLTDIPPLGARFRLKANYPINRFKPQLQVILKAMQTYGIIAADHGASWYISGEPDERWDNEVLSVLHQLKGGDFEAVDTNCLMVQPNSGQADISQCPDWSAS